MTKDEAIKLALDSLVYASSYCDTYDAITALREALAEQPAQQQEPVCDKDPQGCWSVRCQLGKQCKNTPAQRTWVGLTDDERGELWYKFSYMELMKAIEAKLKEKNT